MKMESYTEEFSLDWDVLDCVSERESRKVYNKKTLIFRFIVLKGHLGDKSRGSYNHSFKKWGHTLTSVAQSIGVLSRAPQGNGFDSCFGHVLGLWV